jgi:hypothetical protein
MKDGNKSFNNFVIVQCLKNQSELKTNRVTHSLKGRRLRTIE